MNIFFSIINIFYSIKKILTMKIKGKVVENDN